MVDIIATANTIVGYVPQGISWFRDFVSNLVGANAIFIAFLVISLIVGFLIGKKFVTTPMAGRFIPWTLLIALLIFLLLMYV